MLEALFMGRYPSGQRGLTVNQLAQPSVVRIRPCPPASPCWARSKQGLPFLWPKSMMVRGIGAANAVVEWKGSRACLTPATALLTRLALGDLTLLASNAVNSGPTSHRAHVKVVPRFPAAPAALCCQSPLPEGRDVSMSHAQCCGRGASPEQEVPRDGCCIQRTLN